MENQVEVQEGMKADIQQLKEQMRQVLKTLDALQDPGCLCTQRSQQGAPEARTFPSYGLPPNYPPPSGVDSRHLDTQKAEGNAVEVEHEPGATTFTIPGQTIQPGIESTIMKKQLETKSPSSVITPADFKDDKSILEVLEKRLRAIEDEGSFEFGDAKKLCLVPDVVIPPKFRPPEFEKYRGNTCPRGHISMYCRKMAAYALDEKLLIHFFQESLTDEALTWYMHLDTTHIYSWKHLVETFLRQYGYDKDLTPDRAQLQNMVKKESESFREYAQRWREIAAQVEPRLSDKEMTTTFLSTLQPPFYEHMLKISISSSFTDIVIIGERVESGKRSGKIALGPELVASLNDYGPGHEKDKKRRANSHFTAYPQMSHSYGSSRAIERRNYNRDKRVANFTPIPMTYTELLPDLLRRNLIKICPTRPIRPPYPRSYDVNARCDYHGGACGHSIEACKALKRKVQSLIDSGCLKFEEMQSSTVARLEFTSTNAMDE
ncbi:uncharacterized protein LOC108330329 [Vigna angularis]|uniref:uncharacterized protein LOC108330329 n=1 Tax=Phaseolus angularis TaxID=3914 RepID=UPI0022B54621|nr:uncharacterized protein LOC108330329 [Vigna angularis]